MAWQMSRTQNGAEEGEETHYRRTIEMTSICFCFPQTLPPRSFCMKSVMVGVARLV